MMRKRLSLQKKRLVGKLQSILPALAILSGVAGTVLPLFLIGCSATTPAFNTPQMTPPPLPNRGAGRNTSPSVSPSVKLPPLENVATPKGLFTVAPYRQWGHTAKPDAPTLTLCWQTAGGASDNKTDTWTLETRLAAGQWQKAAAEMTTHPLTLPGQPEQTLWTATIANLTPNTPVDYRLLKDTKPVFAGRTQTVKGPQEAQRFVVFGDTGADTVGQKRVAFQTYQQKPDFIFHTGDVVYDFGRASEYLANHFPIYNADKADPKGGAPLLRSFPMLATLGNHDGVYNNFSKWPDALAYFYYFQLPLNGPERNIGDPNTPKTTGNDTAEKAMITAAGKAYPRMANYSFDAGNTHWTVLDSNYYMNWNNKTFREWLEADLQKAQNANWRFVAFHVPPFHSSDKHQEEQWMRILCPVFEKYKVDIVFSGHVHNFQRTYPMKFVPAGAPDNEGRVKGEWTLQKDFDGKQNTRPNAPIYLVTGAGGAPLYNRSLEEQPEKWQPFTQKYLAAANSFTVVDVTAEKLVLRQLNDTGKEIDQFTITRN